MKSLITILSLLLGFTAMAQNCGQVTNFTKNIVNNGNGTSTYNFSVTIQATSGGSKSVLLTIACPGTTFISNQCEASNSTTRTVNYGPFTVNSCTGDVELTWSGHSNAVCGGTTCNPLQAFSSLPVELSSFRAIKEATQAVLVWETASELNNDKFIIERSSGNDAKFQSLGEVAGKGTTHEAQQYHFVDETPAEGVNYYRLRQIDLDGNFEYSDITTLDFRSQDDIAIFPTLVSEVLKVKLPKAYSTEKTMVSIYNLQGAVLFEQDQIGSDAYEVLLPELQAGQYIVLATCGPLTKRTMIQKF